MYPDEAAFLKSIADSPTDETVRLIYAAWLEEHGDSHGEFARFARLTALLLNVVRELASDRHRLNPAWVGSVDPLFAYVDVRCCCVRMPTNVQYREVELCGGSGDTEEVLALQESLKYVVSSCRR